MENNNSIFLLNLLHVQLLLDVFNVCMCYLSKEIIISKLPSICFISKALVFSETLLLCHCI